MTKHNPTIAITGANGFLGGRLLQHFSDKGWNVIGLVRDPQHTAKPASRNVSFRQYDLSKPIAKDTLKGVDYLVHAAYVKAGGKQDAGEINVSGAQRLLQASREHKVSRNLFISSMSAHDEAISVYGRQKLSIEGQFSGSQDVALKPGLIIGDGGIVREMAGFMRSKRMVPLIGGGKQPLQIVAIQDLVNAIDAALQKKSLSGSYVVANPEVYTYRQFYAALAKRLGISVAYVPVPYQALSLAFQLATALRLPLNIGDDNLKGLKKLRAMDSGPDLQKLGVSLMPLDQALKAVDL